MTKSPLIPETPNEESGGKFSTVNWSIISPNALLKLIVSDSEDILKLVWRFRESSSSISGGVIPTPFGVEKMADKKGIKVKSDELLLSLCPWIDKIFSPSIKRLRGSEIIKRSGKLIIEEDVPMNS